MTKKRSPRSFRGNLINAADWQEVGRVGPVDGVEWILFAKADRLHGWRSLKLAADGKAPRKANYWLGWDGERLAASSDLKRMQVGRPQMEPMVVELLRSVPYL